VSLIPVSYHLASSHRHWGLYRLGRVRKDLALLNDPQGHQRQNPTEFWHCFSSGLCHHLLRLSCARKLSQCSPCTDLGTLRRQGNASPPYESSFGVEVRAF
jgi:hypothetical protein